MALSSTLYRFEIELADMDRQVYESLHLRVAQHPSEDAERLVVRVLARALSHEEDIEFGRGLSHTEDPAIFRASPVGGTQLWVDVGAPTAERLHRASKKADRVVVFTHKPSSSLVKAWASRPIHAADRVEVVRFAPELVTELSVKLSRNVAWFVNLQEGVLSVGDGNFRVVGTMERLSVAAFLAAAG